MNRRGAGAANRRHAADRCIQTLAPLHSYRAHSRAVHDAQEASESAVLLRGQG